MKNYFFTLVTSGKSLVHKIGVVANVITLYIHGKQEEHTFEFAISDHLQQTPPCEGPYQVIDPYKNIQTPLHEFIHSGSNDSHLAHMHYTHCGIITPAVFSSFLDQLDKFQNNPAARAALANETAYLSYAALIKGAKATINNWAERFEKANPMQKGIMLDSKESMKTLSGYTVEIDTQTDYINAATLENAKKMYTDFYNVHQTEIEQRYLQFQKDLTWSDECAEIGNNMLWSFIYSASYAALQATLLETLIAHRISTEKARWMIYAVSLSVIAVANTSWYPLIFAATVLVLLKTLNEFKLMNCSDQTTRFSSNLAATLTAIGENVPLSPYGLLNLTTSLLVAVPTAICVTRFSGYLTQSLWKSCYKNTEASASTASAENIPDQTSLKPHNA